MYEEIFERLKKSEFRSRFKLKEKDKEYLLNKGFETIESHARDFIAKRVAPANPHNDGKQTPTKGHPVFTAQHATACCCRGCINKWHKFPKDVPLTQNQQEFLFYKLKELLYKSSIA